ncbi:uracil-DNA glycosylase family protein [Treponema sp. C6A8]|uniref:uracil-DNA glycosylase n=1 Tax=Treponema sp. C6A8 TaxID=1410609 RepID=UPI000480EC92|nr:uracil-DNA glycosylase [Treponema sp. C6A8]
MKASEKELIFNLLKNASAVANGGFVPPNFASNPLFEDDGDKPAQETPAKIEATGSAPVQESPSAVVLGSQSDASAITIESLASKILRCTHCQLARTRTNVVPGEGVTHPDVLVIGEGPGYDEDMQGRPFVGKAGILLDKMLAAINLDRKTNCFIANIVKCRPPQNRDPFPEEQEACFSFLEAQIKILKPKMILCMGRISGHKMLNTEEPVGKLRGNFFEYNGIPLMITYHPSALLRNQDLKRPAWEDLKKFRQKLDTILGGNQ